MPNITKQLPSGNIAVIKEDGSHFEIDPDGKVVGQPAPTATEETSPLQDIAKKASSFLSNPLDALPLSPAPLIQGGKQTGQAVVAADKNYPAENILPAVGATVGAAAATGAATPFAATMGAGLGGAAGESARQMIARARGHAAPATPMEAATEIGKQGALGAAGELGAAGAIKAYSPIGEGVIESANQAATKIAEKYGIQIPFASRVASEGGKRELGRLANSVGGGALADETKVAHQGLEDLAQKTVLKTASKDSINPSSLESAGVKTPEELYQKSPEQFFKAVKDKSSELYNKIPSDAKVPNESETASTIDQIFQQSGISRSKVPPEIRGKLDQANNDILDSIMGSKPGKVYTDLNSAPSDSRLFGRLGKILDDIENPDLTYGQLKQIRTDLGNDIQWQARNSTNSFEDKLKRKVYYSLTQDMSKTAEANGFSDVAKAANEHFKGFKSAVELNDLLDSSYVRGKFSPQRLANKLQNYTPDEIKSYFGKTAGQVSDLRTIANAISDVRGNGMLMNPLSITRYPFRKVAGETLSNPSVQNVLLHGTGQPPANLVRSAVQGARTAFSDRKNEE